MEWKVKQVDPKKIAGLAAELETSRLMALLLINRGLEERSAALSFLNPSVANLPDPKLLPGLERAVSLLLSARESKEQVTVYGDYDADGLTAAALLTGFLSELGLPVNTYIPHRLDEGYGLHVEAVEALARAGTRYIVTVDLGISDREAVAKARELGLKVVITDHHNPPEFPPKADAVINPKLKGSPPSLRDLAGVGVAFFLAGGIRQALKSRGGIANGAQPELAPYLGLVALGTVADVVPLTRVNRILVSEGLKHLSETNQPGLAALKEVSALPPTRPLTATDVAFRLAPRLNAVGRLDSPQAGLDLLLTRDRDQARTLADMLEDSNRKRKHLQETVAREALARIEEDWDPERKTIILESENWHRGVVGIAASKIVETFHRPTILMSVSAGLARGSGRSIPGFSLHDALSKTQDILKDFGGHDMAAGLSLDAENLPALAQALEEIAALELSEEDLRPSLAVEAEVALEELNQDFVLHLNRLAPYGPGNPEPILAVSGLRCLSAAIVGQNHLRLRLEKNGQFLQTIGFSLGDRLPDLGPRVSVALKPHTSTYQGQTTQGWQVVDIKKDY